MHILKFYPNGDAQASVQNPQKKYYIFSSKKFGWVWSVIGLIKINSIINLLTK